MPKPKTMLNFPKDQPERCILSQYYTKMLHNGEFIKIFKYNANFYYTLFFQ